jgi:hypothetical protein
LKDYFGNKIDKSNINPDEAIELGVAIYARKITDNTLIENTSNSFGNYQQPSYHDYISNFTFYYIYYKITLKGM